MLTHKHDKQYGSKNRMTCFQNFHNNNLCLHILCIQKACKNTINLWEINGQLLTLWGILKRAVNLTVGSEPKTKHFVRKATFTFSNAKKDNSEIKVLTVLTFHNRKKGGKI